MNAAAKAAPSGAAALVPANVKTPEEALDALAAQMADIVKRLVAANASLTRSNLMLRSQLEDALEGVEELRARMRTKEEMIAELQGLTASAVRS